jgi:hypothetical protein
VISSDGITTLSYFATDNEGNTSDVGSITIKLDKTAPEMYIRFDPAKKDTAVFGRDATSGVPAGALAATSIRRLLTGDRGLRAEIRTFDLTDAAGNTLRLVYSTALESGDAVVGITSLQYNGGAETRPSYNILFFEWKLKKNAFDEFIQDAAVITPLQLVRTTWKAKDNVTRITTLAGKSTVPGMFLVRLATNAGGISLETSP